MAHNLPASLERQAMPGNRAGRRQRGCLVRQSWHLASISSRRSFKEIGRIFYNQDRLPAFRRSRSA
jgi:hypothetical protein